MKYIYKKSRYNSASFSYLQVINKQLQLMLLFEPTYQHGLLAIKYQRVYFTTGAEKAENLPDQCFKIPLGIRANYSMGDRLIIRSFYRYYQDDWGLKAHTLDIETPVKITPFVSVSPFYRFYTQNAVNYFAPYAEHSAAEVFNTSDYRSFKIYKQLLGQVRARKTDCFTNCIDINLTAYGWPPQQYW